MKKCVWGTVGSVGMVWLIYVVGVIPLIAKEPNLKTQVAEVNALGRPCGFLNMDDARIIYYLDKPYQIFYDKAHALDWATRVGGVLVTSKRFSDPCCQLVVKGDRWQALIPRQHPLLKNNLPFQMMERFFSEGELQSVSRPSEALAHKAGLAGYLPASTWGNMLNVLR